MQPGSGPMVGKSLHPEYLPNLSTSPPRPASTFLRSPRPTPRSQPPSTTGCPGDLSKSQIRSSHSSVGTTAWPPVALGTEQEKTTASSAESGAFPGRAHRKALELWHRPGLGLLGTSRQRAVPPRGGVAGKQLRKEGCVLPGMLSWYSARTGVKAGRGQWEEADGPQGKALEWGEGREPCKVRIGRGWVGAPQEKIKAPFCWAGLVGGGG